MTDTNNNETSSSIPPHTTIEPNQGRVICTRCERPYPRTCLCEALPRDRLTLKQCHILVLQHPHEVRRKNRSLFLAEFCLTSESITCIRTRKLLSPPPSFPPHSQDCRSNTNEHDDAVIPSIPLSSLLAPDRDVWLIFPHPQAKSLTEALLERRQQQQQKQLTLIFLDATWKFAAEMERASHFPSHAKYVCLDAMSQDLVGIKPKRFDIRTPPTPEHLCTAECLALVASRVEENPIIYETIMRPLDLMVNQWHSFADQK